MINYSKSGKLYFTTKQIVPCYATFLFVFPNTFYKFACSIKIYKKINKHGINFFL